MKEAHSAAAAALLLLNQRAAIRIENVNQFETVIDRDDSEQENDSSCPVLDSFYNIDGNTSLVQMTNYTYSEFNTLWDDLRECIDAKWNKGRGRRCKYGGKDALFMLLVTLKHATKWDLLAHVFGTKAPTFERMTIALPQIVSEHAFELYVSSMHAK